MRIGLGSRDLSIVSCRYNNPFISPLSLFALGEQGGWWDPSDLSTMFQDSAGTTPVTAAGQSVGKINDKSGRGNFVFQPTAGRLPVLQQDAGSRYYLALDGVDDNLITSANIQFQLNSTFMVAILYTSGAAVTGVALAANQMAIGCTATNAYFYSEGVGSSGLGTRDANAHVQLANLHGNATSSLEVDKITLNTSNVGNTVDNSQVSIGSFSGTGSFMAGRWYGGICLARSLTAAEKAGMYTWLGAKAGLVL
jgi:hypothetical protein